MESFSGHFKCERKRLFYDAANIWELERDEARQIRYYIIKETILPQPALGLAVQST